MQPTSFNGDKPQVVRGFEGEYKRLFYSESEIALKLPVTVQEGYGNLPTGTVVCQPTVSGEVVPYPPTNFSGEDLSDFPAMAALVVDGGANAYAYVSNNDSYKFRVGQSVVAARISGESYAYVDGGAITDITQDSGVNGRAKVTFTNVISADFSITNQANLRLKSKSASPYKEAYAITDRSTDAGVGEDAIGGNTSVVISNAVLYGGLINQIDSDAKTDLGASTQGQFLILK